MKKIVPLFTIAAAAMATPAHAAVDLTGDQFHVTLSSTLLGQVADFGNVAAVGQTTLNPFIIDIGSDFFRISSGSNSFSAQQGNPATDFFTFNFTDLTKNFGATGFTLTDTGGVQFQPGFQSSFITGDNVFHANINGTFFPTNSSLTFTLTSADTSGAVPEPATWALMLVGFGAIGFALRRQRKVSLAYA